jgi:hypothetical protein
MSRSGDHHTLLMTTVIAQDDSTNNMWSTYTKEAREYDKVMTNSWKADSMGLLVFVSINPLTLLIVIMT